MPTAAQALAAGIVRQRNPKPLRSTDASRIIDRRGEDTGSMWAKGQPPPTSPVTMSDNPWQALLNKYDSERIKRRAANPNRPSSLPTTGGSLYPPGMQGTAMVGTAQGPWNRPRSGSF